MSHAKHDEPAEKDGAGGTQGQQQQQQQQQQSVGKRKKQQERQGGGVEEEEEEEEEFPPGMEVEEEYDEEDVYVVVGLPPAVDGEALLSASSVSVKGIGTKTPQLKVGEEVYEGNAEPIIGTTMAFTTPKPGASGREPLELTCFSNMRMAFSQPAVRRQRRSKP
ncbi:unnamed protein product [Ectocarpus fasciculatus]